MKKILACFTLCIASTTAYAHPQDGMSPEDLMLYYVKVFNEENMPALEEIYHFPHAKIINGKLTLFDNKDIPVIDYVGLKKTGWKFSKINYIKVLSESENSALVEMNFSRYDKDEKEFLRSTGFYVLTKNMGYWQILSLNSIGNIAGTGINR
ncbi:MAG: hypothetical protein O3B03_03420 [Proteobacteria bacterium]|nr:hypothetical protein [Pseudomonadota bacterium]MDA1332172.1 hypothetical protein [Pseudomonadota bacterium]